MRTPVIWSNQSIIGWIKLKRMKCRDGSMCWMHEKRMFVRKLRMKITTWNIQHRQITGYKLFLPTNALFIKTQNTTICI
jgi:hypothetical protein